jgi:hypothetical protein
MFGIDVPVHYNSMHGKYGICQFFFKAESLQSEEVIIATLITAYKSDNRVFANYNI